ncbi:MAG: protein-L-isoaspartate(D-aspartate) O-methyltransferase [Candidatus Eisenbacteria bacterium]|nr:protein-L-isoaspartate(D-aspartate) O-methyltransferase [Candidatus Eisenbacteria bacterium]
MEPGGRGEVKPLRGAESYRSARERMVRVEVEERGIHDDRVLRALLDVPRHLFADEALAAQTYRGNALPIGWGQTLSQPWIVARMTEALELGGGERILEVGTGSGYQAAVLSRLGCRVFSVERVPELARRARRLLDRIGVERVSIRSGDGAAGWRDFAPFDRILLTAGTREIPEPVREQLADPGVLVAPLGTERQTLTVLRRERGRDRIETLEDCRFVPLLPRRSENVGGADGRDRKAQVDGPGRDETWKDGTDRTVL